jgi:type I restriction enzyme S subunit
LNQKILKSVVFPLPPLPEQRRIVAEVERRLSVVDALEREVEAALARAARLRQSILKRAFEGRLVLQDPNDEPASVLLERIRAQRETGKKAEKTNRKKKQLRQLELL